MQLLEAEGVSVPFVSDGGGFRGVTPANDVIFFQLHPPSWTATSAWVNHVIGLHRVGPRHGVLPYTKSLTKNAFDVCASLGALDRIEAPTDTIEYLKGGRKTAFTPDFRADYSRLPRCLVDLGVLTRSFYVHVLPRKFVDRFDADQPYGALHRATGLSVLQLSEMELLERKEEIFHG